MVEIVCVNIHKQITKNGLFQCPNVKHEKIFKFVAFRSGCFNAYSNDCNSSVGGDEEWGEC